MENSELIERLKKYPNDADILPRNNSYLKKSWLRIQYIDKKGNTKTDAIMVE